MNNLFEALTEITIYDGKGNPYPAGTFIRVWYKDHDGYFTDLTEYFNWSADAQFQISHHRALDASPPADAVIEDLPSRVFNALINARSLTVGLKRQNNGLALLTGQNKSDQSELLDSQVYEIDALLKRLMGAADEDLSTS